MGKATDKTSRMAPKKSPNDDKKEKKARKSKGQSPPPKPTVTPEMRRAGTAGPLAARNQRRPETTPTKLVETSRVTRRTPDAKLLPGLDTKTGKLIGSFDPHLDKVPEELFHFVSAPKRHYFCDETIYFPETKRLHLVTDLFSTASIKTSRTSSEPTATTSLSVDQPSDACDQPQSQMCDPQSEITSTSATEVEDSSTQKTQKKGANRNYQDSWKAIYPFIDYDPVKKNVLQNLCRFQNSKKLICTWL